MSRIKIYMAVCRNKNNNSHYTNDVGWATSTEEAISRAQRLLQDYEEIVRVDCMEVYEDEYYKPINL